MEKIYSEYNELALRAKALKLFLLPEKERNEELKQMSNEECEKMFELLDGSCDYDVGSDTECQVSLPAFYPCEYNRILPCPNPRFDCNFCKFNPDVKRADL